MICSYCAKENPDEAIICNFCGAPLVVKEDASTTEPLFTVPEENVIEPPVQPGILPPSPATIVPEKPRGIYGNKIWWIIGCAAVFIIFLCCGVGVLFASRLVSNFPNLSLSPDTIFSSSEPAAIETLIPLNDVPDATDPNLLLFDDFSDPESGWDRVDETDYYTDYYNGSYRIIVYTDMSDSWANPSGQSYGDVSIEVAATKNGGPDDNDFGIICRYQDVDNFYYGLISSDGFYGIMKVVDASSEQLGNSELQSSDLINQGTATNQIRFVCAGDMLSLYVNGQLIDEQVDSAFTQGNVGLLAGTYDIPGTDILFDNFTVTRP
jgi:hypothetical protein